MADISMGNLRFDLTADNSAFNDAIKRAQETHTAAAQEMGKQMEDASKRAEAAHKSMWENIGNKTYEAIRKIQDFGKAVGEAISNGAEGAEAFTKTMFEKAMNGAESWTKKILASIPVVGKLLTTIYELGEASGAVKWVWDNIGKSIANAVDGLMSKARPALAAIGSTYVDAYALAAQGASTAAFKAGFIDEDELKRQADLVKSWADGIKQTFADLYEGIQTYFQKLAGTFNGIREDVKAALKSLQETNNAKEFQNGLIGLDDGGRSRAVALNQALKAAGKTWDELNEKEKEALTTALDRNEAITNEGASMQRLVRDAQQYEQSVQSVTAALKRQGDLALANAGQGYGKSAYDRALQRGQAIAEGYGRGRNQGITNDPAVQDALRSSADAQQQAANIKFNYDLAEAIRFQSAAYDVQTASLGASAGESTRLKFTQDELNKAYREGVPITDSLRASIDASATALGRASQAAADAKERFEAFKQVGQTVASSLESAFDKWISGTRTNFSELIRGMAQDLAKLSFKRGIEGLLTGTSATGGGLFGMLANAFGGFRANGGDVNSGNSYIVGERGPELFVPRGSGSIVSNQALQGSGSVPQVINMKIDLTGANGDDTIARISAAAARQAFAQAVAQANAMAPGRQRSFQMLGA